MRNPHLEKDDRIIPTKSNKLNEVKSTNQDGNYQTEARAEDRQPRKPIYLDIWNDVGPGWISRAFWSDHIGNIWPESLSESGFWFASFLVPEAGCLGGN